MKPDDTMYAIHQDLWRKESVSTVQMPLSEFERRRNPGANVHLAMPSAELDPRVQAARTRPLPVVEGRGTTGDSGNVTLVRDRYSLDSHTRSKASHSGGDSNYDQGTGLIPGRDAQKHDDNRDPLDPLV